MRGVVAGIDANGRSAILYDGPPTGWYGARPQETMAGSAAEMPLGLPDAGAVAVGQCFPIDGMRLPTLAEIPHDGPSPPVEGPCRCIFVSFGPNVDTPMHSDNFIGVAVVTKGAVRLEVETGSAWLEVGDMCVVPPVQHAWHTDERGGLFAFTAVPVT